MFYENFKIYDNYGSSAITSLFCRFARREN